jgi:hypothetical protein
MFNNNSNNSNNSLVFTNTRSKKKALDQARVSPYSFVQSWQSCTSLHEVYENTEKQWQEFAKKNNLSHRRPKFFKNREEGFKALRSRATYYRNKGVELQKFHDEIKKYAGPTKINWKHLADFARQVKNQ